MNPLFHVYYCGYQVCTLEIRPFFEDGTFSSSTVGLLIAKQIATNMQPLYQKFVLGLLNTCGQEFHTLKSGMTDFDNLCYVLNLFGDRWHYDIENRPPTGERVALPFGVQH